MKKETVETIKKVSALVVGAGCGLIVTNAVKFTTPAALPAIKKVLVGIGGLVAGDMLAKKAGEHVGKEIDDLVECMESSEEEESDIELEGVVEA